MLWAIQPTEALGYPAHRNALAYPAHRSFGLSEPTEMLWAIQPTEMLWAIQLTEMFWDIQPTEMLWAIQPTEIYIYPAYFTMCQHTPHFFFAHVPLLVQLLLLVGLHPHPQSCHFPASSSDLLPTFLLCSRVLLFTCKICRPPLILTAQLPTLL